MKSNERDKPILEYVMSQASDWVIAVRERKELELGKERESFTFIT